MIRSIIEVEMTEFLRLRAFHHSDRFPWLSQLSFFTSRMPMAWLSTRCENSRKPRRFDQTQQCEKLWTKRRKSSHWLFCLRKRREKSFASLRSETNLLLHPHRPLKPSQLFVRVVEKVSSAEERENNTFICKTFKKGRKSGEQDFFLLF